jgi:hypothetical protein
MSCSLETIFASTEESLAQRLAARAMPIEGKQRWLLRAMR